MHDKDMDTFGYKPVEDSYIVSGLGTVSSLLADRIARGTTFANEVISLPYRPATGGVYSVNSAKP